MTAARPTRHASRACAPCQRLKARCKGSHPCSRCIERGIECTFRSSGKKRGPESGGVALLRSRIAILENLLGRLSRDPNTKRTIEVLANDLHRHLESCSHDGSFGSSCAECDRNSLHWTQSAASGRLYNKAQPRVEGDLKAFRFIPTEPTSLERNRPETDNTALNNHHQLSVSTRNSNLDRVFNSNYWIYFNTDSNSTFYGKSSSLCLLAQVEFCSNQWRKYRGHASLSLLSLNPKTASHPSLPPIATQQLLVTTYLKFSHPLINMIDMEKIYQRVFANQVTDDPTFDMVLFAIFAFAAHHVPSLHGTELVNSTAGDYYANCAMTMVKSLFNVNKIRTVQVLVLLAWRSQGCGQDEDAWLYTGLLVRMAQACGLHHGVSGDLHMSKHESQMRSALWWQIYELDKLCSLYSGRPPLIRESDYTVGEPEMDFPSFDLSVKADEADFQLMSFKWQCAISPGFRRYGEVLFRVLSFMQENHDVTPSKFEDLRQELIKWKVSLPINLEYEPPSETTVTTIPCPPHYVLTMHLLYYVIVIMVHRARIPSTLGGSKVDCIKAADALINTVNHYRLQYSLKAVVPFVIHAILNAATIHSCALLSEQTCPSDKENARSFVNLALLHLEEIGQSWRLAMHVAATLKGITAEGKVPSAIQSTDSTTTTQADVWDEHSLWDISALLDLPVDQPTGPEIPPTDSEMWTSVLDIMSETSSAGNNANFDLPEGMESNAC